MTKNELLKLIRRTIESTLSGRDYVTNTLEDFQKEFPFLKVKNQREDDEFLMKVVVSSDRYSTTHSINYEEADWRDQLLNFIHEISIIYKLEMLKK